MNNRCTEGNVYLEAARRLSLGEDGGQATVALHAVGVSENELFGLFSNRSGLWFHSIEEKVLCLCFMAAMVEAGDA